MEPELLRIEVRVDLGLILTGHLQLAGTDQARHQLVAGVFL
ncbi:hypothetical protein ACWDXH_30380 [Micromonospora chokoriensis]